MSTIVERTPRTTGTARTIRPSRPQTDLVDDGVRRSLDELAALPSGDPKRIPLRNEIVSKTLPLADRLARRFAHRGEPLEDLTQVARVGLLKSVEGFDPERGSGFIGYAVPTILGELKRHFRDKGWSMRVPRRLQEAMVNVNSSIDPLSQQLGRTPTVDDLAEHLGLDAETVRDGMGCAHAYAAMSLHTPTEHDGGREIIDMVGNEDPALEAAEARVAVEPLLAKLPDRERNILKMRFFDGMTQSQIASKVHLSQMHVSRLISRNLTRMREWMRDGAEHASARNG
ncbi:SigB/SigF/SigG family RNA polymerase sigma factor [Phytomonospora sp. NPDC050363]|uniref:SigB/SigF/SigG family RNA polymerase sigma factor n=1 Tax=Phytomonospora sp. NPDC050363 TaxID=3155642 RepID=UPI0034073A28